MITKAKILTPDEYVQLQIVTYPTLYGGFNTTYEEAKMKVLFKYKLIDDL